MNPPDRTSIVLAAIASVLFGGAVVWAACASNNPQPMHVVDAISAVRLAQRIDHDCRESFDAIATGDGTQEERVAAIAKRRDGCDIAMEIAQSLAAEDAETARGR